MGDKNECYAYFRITGSFDPAAITAKVGVEASNTTVKGEFIPRTQKRRDFSSWNLYSRLERSAALESHITDVLDQLDANKAAFRELALEHGGVIELVGYFYAFYPGIFLQHEIVERLAEYALSIDCDFYFPFDAEDASKRAGDQQ
jgi:hypothetical protein